MEIELKMQIQKEEKPNQEDNKSEENLKRKNNILKKLATTELLQILAGNNTFENLTAT
jgi:hypothetical protein